jgi:hypothetical protein
MRPRELLPLPVGYPLIVGEVGGRPGKVEAYTSRIWLIQSRDCDSDVTLTTTTTTMLATASSNTVDTYRYIPTPRYETYCKVINQIRSKMNSASDTSGPHILSFNVLPEHLDAAHKLLDKEDQRRAIRQVQCPTCGG